MSFRCDFCQKPSPPRTTMRLVTTKTRQVGRETQIVQQRRQCVVCYQQTPEALQERMNDGKQYSSALRFK